MTALLTTVIGLVGVYIAFALAASWVNEQIATFLQLRSKTLIAGVRSMIGDAAAAQFFRHPLILSLGEAPAPNFWSWLGTAFGLRYVNQAIPKLPATTPTTTPAMTPQSTTTSDDSQPAAKNPAYISAEHFAVVLLDVLRRQAPGASPLAALGASSSDVAAAINTISDPNNPYNPLYKVLLPIWTDARADYDRFADALGSWYDSQMDRVSGWYKRSAQIFLVYIGLALAIGFNLDTIAIVQELQHNTTLANTLAAATQAYYEAQQTAIKAGKPALTSPLAVTQPCQSSSGACTCDEGFVPVKSGSAQLCSIDSSVLAQLPIGWSQPRWKTFRDSLYPNSKAPLYEFPFASGFWMKVFGLAITVVAILLGAPFWFDVLGTIVNVRSVGAKPSPSNGT
jgi:hypothetical protein